MPVDFLLRNLRDLPYFRGFLRAIESRFYQEFELDSPVLDMGCGDGQFVTVTFDKKIDIGIDPWAAPVREAQERGGYHLVIQGDGAHIPVADGYFANVFSNSVLEHIPDLDPVINEIHRVVKEDGMFLFCVPNHQFLGNLSISTMFDRLHLRRIADAYRKFFNAISRHHHCDSPEVWQERLATSGFQVIRWWHYFSPRALHILEWGHYFGIPSWIIHAITGNWILVKQPWNLALTKRLVQPYYDEDSYHQPNGSYTFYVARKTKA
ncbi:MAG: class I SAM-dependent methyltransferase [Anaerolineae bacterium]|nr:class I SAM-dependent methyltransferase [Anaerolineae bacterium]